MKVSEPKRLLASIKAHDCGNKTIVQAKDILALRFGAKCHGCGKKWMTKMSVLKHPEGVRLLAYLHDPFASRR